LAHQAADKGAYVSQGLGDTGFTLDRHPEHRSSLFYADVGVLRRHSVLDREAGCPKFIREPLGSLRRALVGHTDSHVDTVTGLRDG
jgi:hypothetical protein